MPVVSNWTNHSESSEHESVAVGTLVAPARRKNRRPAVEVRSTRTGLGVVSCRGWAAGQRVGIVRGELVSDGGKGSRYAIEVGGDLALEPAAPFRFVNHSCDPNCQFAIEETDAGQPRVVLETIRPIAASDELTVDYAWPAADAVPCQCGSDRCRGWIVALAEADQVRGNLPHESLSIRD